jgi:hypothetical protein
MSDPSLFTWRRFKADSILYAVHWYLRYDLSDCAIECCFELRIPFQHLAIDSGMVDRDPTLLHHLFGLVVA